MLHIDPVKLLHNPLVKSVSVAIIGAVGPAVLSAIDHPTGGFGQAIATNPSYGLVYGLGAMLAHNFWTSFQLKDLSK